jgi:hypothetical protein
MIQKKWQETNQALKRRLRVLIEVTDCYKSVAKKRIVEAMID